MKVKFFFFLCLLIIVSCGGGKADKSASSSNHSENNTSSNCKMDVRKNDSPAIIARKAFRMHSDCKLKTEDELVRKMIKV